MADVLRIAHERRAELRAEIAKLDEFIRMGEALIRYSRANAARQEAGAVQQQVVKSTPVTRPATVPSGNSAGKTDAQAAEDPKKGADVSRPTIIRQGNTAG